MQRFRPLGARIRWGVGLGLGTGALLSAWVGVLFFGNGKELEARYGLSVLQIVMLYLAAGVVGGALLGALLPLARWRIGSVLLGVMIGTTVYSMAALAMLGPERFRPAYGLLPGIVVGGLLGVFLSGKGSQ